MQWEKNKVCIFWCIFQVCKCIFNGFISNWIIKKMERNMRFDKFLRNFLEKLAFFGNFVDITELCARQSVRLSLFWLNKVMWGVSNNSELDWLSTSVRAQKYLFTKTQRIGLCWEIPSQELFKDHKSAYVCKKTCKFSSIFA